MSVEISIRNAGCLEEADFRVDGITVIAGQNNTGKSTILKTLYSVLICPEDFEFAKHSQIVETTTFLMSRHSKERIRYYPDDDLDDEGIQWTIEYLQDRIGEDDKQDWQTLEYTIGLIDGTNDDDFYSNLIHNRIRSEFDGMSQFRNMDSEGETTVRIEKGLSLTYRVHGGGETTCECDRSRVPRTVYFDSPFNVDDGLIGISVSRHLNHRRNIGWLLNMRPDDNIIMRATHRSNVDRLDAVIKESIPGMFVNTKEGLRYRTPKGYLLSPKNVASGIKVFGTIRKLVDNGQLYEGSILLLDEPEAHLIRNGSTSSGTSL